MLKVGYIVRISPVCVYDQAAYLPVTGGARVVKMLMSCGSGRCARCLGASAWLLCGHSMSGPGCNHLICMSDVRYHG